MRGNPCAPPAPAPAEPLGQAKHEVKSELLGPHRALRVVLEAPRGTARPGRGAPGALLERDKEPQHERVTSGALKGLEPVRLREVGRGAHTGHAVPPALPEHSGRGHRTRPALSWGGLQ